MPKLKLVIEYVYAPELGIDEDGYGNCLTIQDALKADSEYANEDGLAALVDFVLLNMNAEESWKLEIVED